jgi:hypothetical protein
MTLDLKITGGMIVDGTDTLALPGKLLRSGSAA